MLFFLNYFQIDLSTYSIQKYPEELDQKYIY